MAAFIPEDKIQAIKNVCDIVEIVSDTVSLRRSGRNYLGLCPFHAEKTPSFTVSPDKQIFYCFGCGAGGNVFSFLMKQSGMSFPEAARSLAERYGIDLPSPNLSAYEKKKLTERELILTLNGEAMKFYRDCLFSDRGREAMRYLLQRGITPKTIETGGLGFAPDGWDHLLRHFRSQRRSVDVAARAGLVIPRQKGQGYYDRFRNRVTFPILSGQGKPIGFGGRVMDKSLPKYLNSPETPVYHKARSLYGLDRARVKSRETGTIYVVEGYFDRLAMQQFGIENTVATLGTSLTADHVQILKGFVGENGRAILVYDSDRAGIKAAERSVGVFQKGLLEARILVLPEGHDPDSFLMAHGPDDFLKATEKAMGMLPFMVESAINRYGLGIDGKVRIVNTLREALLAISDPVARSLQVKYLAERIDVDEAVILQKVRQSTATPPLDRRRPVAPSPPEKRIRGEAFRLERQLVTMMLQFPEMIADIRQRRLLAHFTDPLLAEIGHGIVEHYTQPGDNDIAGLISRWEEPKKKAIIARLAMNEEQWDRSGCERLINQFERSRRRRDKDLLKRIEAAEKSGDVELLARLLQEKQHQVRNTVQKHSGLET
ncbi:DNA primase [Desulfosarcina cetonica]|uniref:DNA primase n=1 Tax=Desulfosarcina cetonica TaxID=90730 RepID=UPI0006D1BCB9|nr:DNA primase [Desulfosarcina cetonica]VTR65149.1 DNA primase [Desulfosarcina cetonica]